MDGFGLSKQFGEASSLENKIRTRNKLDTFMKQTISITQNED